MPRKATRNAQGGGSIRKRPDGRWEARYTTGRDPGTGKQIQKSVYGETQAEVRKKLQVACTAIDDGLYTDPSKMTLGTWLDIWLKEYIGNVKPFTVRAYHDRVRLYITPALGAVKLTVLNTHSIQAFYNTLQKGNGDKPGLSPKTVKNVHGVLHAALKQAVLLGYLHFNPSDACTLPRLIKPEIKPLQEDDIGAFLEVIQNDEYEIIYLVDMFTGMRQGEILGLTWDCVDFDSGTILVDKQLQKEKKKGGKYVLETNKNGKARLISPAPHVMEALKKQRQVQSEQRSKAGETWEISPLVFTNELGRHLVHGTVYRHFKRLVAQIGLPETRFHDLRHTYAVAALRAGDDVKTVQETLGHHTAAFTLDVYGHVTERMRKDSAQRMEEYIKSIQRSKG